MECWATMIVLPKEDGGPGDRDWHGIQELRGCLVRQFVNQCSERSEF